LDPREKGEPLWAKKHSLRKLEKERGLDEETFNCMNQGNPISQAGLLYKPFNTYLEIPQVLIKRAYVDTADKGKDYLCGICYAVPLDHNDDRRFILDILYTDEPMEVTEPLTAKMFDNNAINEPIVESNNGGRGFARAIQNLVNPNCVIDWFYQSENKESRIISNAAAVNRRIMFPVNWETRWPTFYKHVKNYKKLFNANSQDGGPDVLTGIVEDEIRNNGAVVIW